jgi:hypothetical protein
MNTAHIVPQCSWDTPHCTVIMKDGRYARGLVDVLHTTFYPRYNYRRARHTDRAVSPLGQVVSCGRVPAPPTLGTTGRVLRGTRRGTTVDQELSDFHTHGRPPQLPETSRILQYLTRVGLVLVSCQFPVVDSDSRLCTCIDLLGRRADGTYVIIEVKTGYRQYKFQYTAKMQHFLHYLTDCPYNQHQLQLYVTLLLFRTAFPVSVYKSDSLLVYVYPDRIEAHGALASLTPHADTLYALLQASKSISRSVRSRGRRRLLRSRTADRF